MTALQSAIQLGHGDHVCAFIESPEQQRDVVAEFVRSGLEAGDRVWYFTDTVPADDVLAELRNVGVDVDTATSGGQLAVQSAEHSYLAELPFEPQRMIDALHRAVDEALADGFGGLRVSGDMAWATRDVPGAERLLEYEARVGELFATRPAAAICQYDRSRFDRTTLAATVGLHNRQLRAAEPPLTIIRSEHSLRLIGAADLAGQAQLRTALGALDDDRVHLDLRELTFMDVCCLNELLRLRARLVLHDPPSVVTRMLNLLGCRDAVEIHYS